MAALGQSLGMTSMLLTFRLAESGEKREAKVREEEEGAVTRKLEGKHICNTQRLLPPPPQIRGILMGRHTLDFQPELFCSLFFGVLLAITNFECMLCQSLFPASTQSGLPLYILVTSQDSGRRSYLVADACQFCYPKHSLGH